MRHGSLFSGIGGFDLASEWMGWDNVFHCEWNEFGQKVLKYYWPQAISYGDITKTDFTIHRGQIDILTGGFPCQPFSSAGKRKGTDDERHLWPEMLRAIREISPRWIVGENVRGFTNWNGGMVFDQVQADLEAEGYEVTPFLLPACAVNAPHRRDRIWIVAKNTISDGCIQRESEQEGTGNGKLRDVSAGGSNGVCLQEGIVAHAKGTNAKRRGESNNKKRESDTEKRGGFWDEFTGNGQSGPTPDTQSKRLEGQNGVRMDGTIQPSECITPDTGGTSSRNPSFDQRGTWQDFPTQPPVCSRNDGLPSELAGITVSKHRKESIKAYGNAIVPQVAYQIFKAIEAL